MSNDPSSEVSQAAALRSRAHSPKNWAAVITLATEPVAAPVLQRSQAEWRAVLDAQVFAVTRLGGTEAAFSSAMCTHFSPGRYACACCAQALFDANEKFDSGSGWPSFTLALDHAPIAYIRDNSYGLERIEVQCSHCGAHLGHVFPDGPAPSGLRYCVNALALQKI